MSRNFMPQMTIAEFLTQQNHRLYIAIHQRHQGSMHYQRIACSPIDVLTSVPVIQHMLAIVTDSIAHIESEREECICLAFSACIPKICDNSIRNIAWSVLREYVLCQIQGQAYFEAWIEKVYNYSFSERLSKDQARQCRVAWLQKIREDLFNLGMELHT